MVKPLRLKPLHQRLRRYASKVEKAAARHQRRFFTASLDNLRQSRLLIAGWLLVVIALILIVAAQSFIFNREISQNAGVAGGTYAEGVVGRLDFINPLFVSTEPELAASQLVYSPLFSYDASNHLRGELAKSYAVSYDGLRYDVKIRHNIRWHGSDRAITVDDVIFTLGLIKNPLTTSTLYATWRSITVEKIDDDTVRFTLRSPLASFPSALTFGVLPQNELSDVKPEDLREYISEHTILGSGPYKYHSMIVNGDTKKTGMFQANKDYWRGAPKIDSFYYANYTNSAELLAGFVSGNITGAVGLSTSDAQMAHDSSYGVIDAVPLDSGVFAIFNMNTLTDINVRRALLLSVDRAQLRDDMRVGDKKPNALDTPIAPQTYASVDELKQAGYDKGAAVSLAAKGTKLNIVTLKYSDYETAANILAEQWRAVGFDPVVTAVEATSIQQSFLIPRSYDVLVYQLQLGADADVYAYWHSSNIKPQGLNFANYNSPVADVALFAGRTALDAATREQKTKTFAEQWLADIPAIALYQPNLYYLHADGINGISAAPLADESDRFRDVYLWTVKNRWFYKSP